MLIPSIYKDFFENKQIKLDDAQIDIISTLYQLHQEIFTYKKDRSNKFTTLIKRPKISHGIYIWGDVGCGKSMLVSAFFDRIPLVKKKQIHFQEFMIQVHKLLKKERENKTDLEKKDYIKNIAQYLSKKYRLIYIDELEINDITDAMIVGKLFQEMLANNICLVITSNRKPDELYKDGLQRELFLNFIDLIKEKLKITNLSSNIDYRRQKITSLKQTYYTPLGKEADIFLQSSFNEITQNGITEQKIIEVNGRKLLCPLIYKDICWFEFEELFKEPLGSSDFIALCQNFNIIFIRNIPKLSKEDRDEARRFITFIDTAYINKVIIICSAMVEPNLIYEYGKGAFEFERVASRLFEMQSISYLKKE